MGCRICTHVKYYYRMLFTNPSRPQKTSKTHLHVFLLYFLFPYSTNLDTWSKVLCTFHRFFCDFLSVYHQWNDINGSIQYWRWQNLRCKFDRQMIPLEVCSFPFSVSFSFPKQFRTFFFWQSKGILTRKKWSGKKINAYERWSGHVMW